MREDYLRKEDWGDTVAEDRWARKENLWIIYEEMPEKSIKSKKEFVTHSWEDIGRKRTRKKVLVNHAWGDTIQRSTSKNLFRNHAWGDIGVQW